MTRYKILEQKMFNNQKEIKALWSKEFKLHEKSLKGYLEDMKEDIDFDYIWSDDLVFDVDQDITHTVATDLLGVDFDNDEDAEFFSDYANEISEMGNVDMYELIKEYEV